MAQTPWTEGNCSQAARLGAACSIPCTSCQETANKGQAEPRAGQADVQEKTVCPGNSDVCLETQDCNNWEMRVSNAMLGHFDTNYNHLTWIRWIYYELSSPSPKLLLCEDWLFCQKRVLGKNLHMADVSKAQVWLWLARKALLKCTFFHHSELSEGADRLFPPLLLDKVLERSHTVIAARNTF